MEEAARLREGLRHVTWIGGASGAGKTTVAERLADQYGLTVYSTDRAMADHGRRCDLRKCRLLADFKGMSMDERWLNRPPRVMLDTFHWFAGEAFELIIEDLLAMPPASPVIVEGFRLLPRLLRPLLARPERCVFLLPTPEFRFQAFKRRGTLWDIAGKTSEPKRALKNLLERDALFSQRLEAELDESDLPVISVDGSRSIESVTRQLARQFELSG